MKKQADTSMGKIDEILYRKNTEYINILNTQMNKPSRSFQDNHLQPFGDNKKSGTRK